MRNPEEQERFLAHERFGEMTAAERQRRAFRRRGCLAIPVALCMAFGVWIGISRMGAHFTKTVATGEHAFQWLTSQHSEQVHYGYSIEKYRWQGYGLKIHFWAGNYLDLRFNAPQLKLVTVKSQRWLASNRVILIGLDYVIDIGSYSPPGELWLLYDFERGELRSCGPDSPWLVWPPKRGKGREMSCDDLRAYAKTLE